jgi:hypothetical protein
MCTPRPAASIDHGRRSGRKCIPLGVDCGTQVHERSHLTSQISAAQSGALNTVAMPNPFQNGTGTVVRGMWVGLCIRYALSANGTIQEIINRKAGGSRQPFQCLR